MRNRDSRQKRTENSLSRRNFLSAGLASAALPFGVLKASRPATSAATSGPLPSAESSRAQGVLPSVPSLHDLASDRLVQHVQDRFNGPLTRNNWGMAQAVKSVSAIKNISYPPYACCGADRHINYPGSTNTCETFLDGRILDGYPEGTTVAYTWYLDRIVRETQVKGLAFRTDTFLPWNQRAVAESIEIANHSGERRCFKVGFSMRAHVTVAPGKPGWPSPEYDNKRQPSEDLRCVVFEAQHSPAVSVQGVMPRPTRIEGGRMFVYELTLEPGATRTFHYVNVIGRDKQEMLDAYDRMQAGFDNLMKENERENASLVRAAFTPGNSRFSGHLPQLVTRDKSLWKLYYTAILDLLMVRGKSPDSVIGPTYLTIPPHVPTANYIWDTMLTSLSLALLDPQVLRTMVEQWLSHDMHVHHVVDYLTGKALGGWYGVNDMGLLRCSHDYLRTSGDFAWLDKKLNGKTVLDHLMDCALYWKKIDKNGDGLGDYGGLTNLLDVVSTWQHEVAAMNAGNVYGLRLMAAILEKRGETDRPVSLRKEAAQLANRINRMLYVQGKGWWRTRQPDGSYNEVRHCYDFLTVLDTMFEDLSPAQKREMRQFFWSDLYSPLWMHALSPCDPMASCWSERSDHTAVGAYAAWPSMAAKGLLKIDSSERPAEWLRGLAKSANQGPFGQAHIVDLIEPVDAGGATKSVFHNWVEICGGSFADLVIDSIFGANLTLYGGVKVHSRVGHFDPGAKLVNLRYQGKSYTVTSTGAGLA